MRTICVINHKGGVGKTTTAVNLAAGLSRRDKNILLIDLDPQNNVGVSLKVQAEYSAYDALIGKVPLDKCIINLAKNLDVVTSRENLTKAEFYLSTQPNARMLLKTMLQNIKGYDYVIIDCPPSLGILNQNVMAFCQEAIIPVSTDYLGMDALHKMKRVVEEINRTFSHNLKISKVVPTLYDKRSKIAQESLQEMHKFFPGIVAQPIRSNSKLKEAPKYGKSIFSFARSSPGAEDYQKLVLEVAEMGQKIVEEAVC
ncbi:ParA family protein [Candidatus Woesearchaeota archaeon]|nr:ParA family protein [Candidatus Woesearchaeota archaeon]